VPPPESIAAECDLSYPDFCLPPPPPDLNCTDIGKPLTVIHRPLLGVTDPHNLDPDGNGMGCEYLAP
jgi:micrococcal nuclease